MTYLVHTRTLIKKNVSLQLRHVSLTLVQLFIGLVLLFFVLLLKFSDSSIGDSYTYTVETRHPKPYEIQPLRGCVPEQASTGRCYDFVYAPKGDPFIEDVIDRVIESYENGQGRGGVMGFDTSTEVEDWLYENPNRTTLALLFDSLNASASLYQYTISANMTVICNEINTLYCTDPKKEIVSPAQMAIDNAIFKIATDSNDASIKYTYVNFPHPDSRNLAPVVPKFIGQFVYLGFILNFVIQGSLILDEKSNGLREALGQLGMSTLAYWTSWMLTNIVMNLCMVVILYVGGFIMGFEVFKESSFGLLFLQLLLSSLSFTGLVMLFSTVAKKSEHVRSFGLYFLYFLGNSVAPVLSLIYWAVETEKDSDSVRLGLSYAPPVSFFLGFVTILVEKSKGATLKGLDWAMRKDSIIEEGVEVIGGPNINGTWSMEDTLVVMFLSFLFYSVGAIVIEIVKSQFLTKSFGGRDFSPTDSFKEELDPTARDELEATLAASTSDPDTAIRIVGLVKSFRAKPFTPGAENLGWGNWRVRAVDDFTMTIKKNTIFGLLGHNGAGKSTTINMLVGNLRVTRGDAFIHGMSIRDDMANIHRTIGVCPQHDVLWDKLTAREHLNLFAEMKGVGGDLSGTTAREAFIENHTAEILAEVLLTEVRDQLVGTFSGGMKRRMSVALALVGNPKVVFLDEPTTGMDPVTRADVWKMIERAKRGRCIILTTHSMEEADTLCDRIGIMADGRLAAIGTATQLKDRFGSGLRLTMLCDIPKMETIINKILSYEFDPRGLAQNSTTASIMLIHRVENALLFQLPALQQNSGGHLSSFLKKVEEMKADVSSGVQSVSLGQCTLEDVFLKISDDVEAKVKRMKDQDNDKNKKSTCWRGKKKKDDENFISLNDAATTEDLESLKKLFDNSNRTKVVGTKVDFFKNVFFATFDKNFKYMTRTGKKNMAFFLLYMVGIGYALTFVGGLFDPIFLNSACGDPDRYLRQWETGEKNESKGDKKIPFFDKDSPITYCRQLGPNITELVEQNIRKMEFTPMLMHGILEDYVDTLDMNLAGIEQPNWNVPFIVDSAAASDTGYKHVYPTDEGTAAAVTKWYDDLIFKAWNTTCDRQNDKYFDCGHHYKPSCLDRVIANTAARKISNDDKYYLFPDVFDCVSTEEEEEEEGGNQRGRRGQSGVSAGRRLEEADGVDYETLDAEEINRRCEAVTGENLEYRIFVLPESEGGGFDNNMWYEGKAVVGNLTKPDPDVIAALDRIYEKVRLCPYSSIVLDHFSSSKIEEYGLADGNLASILESAITNDESGLLEHFTSQDSRSCQHKGFLGPCGEGDKVLERVTMTLMADSLAGLAASGFLLDNTTQFDPPNNLIPPSWFTGGTGSLQTYCEESVNMAFLTVDIKSWVLPRAVQQQAIRANSTFSDETATDIVNNLCAFATNLDAVRSLQMNTGDRIFDTAIELEDHLFDSWNGEEVTATMGDAKYANDDLYDQGYKSRFFRTDWAALHIKEANKATGQYNVNIYTNWTGAQIFEFQGRIGVLLGLSRDTPNWVYMANNLNRAVLKSHTGLNELKLETRTKDFPSYLTCNREEWLKAEEEYGTGQDVVKLNCNLFGSFLDNVIDVFLNGNNLFFLFGPFFFSVLMIPFTVIIVHEKEQGLRQMMMMMGLSNFSYWTVTYSVFMTMYLIFFALMYFIYVVLFDTGVTIFSFHDTSLVLLMFLLWGHIMISFSAVFSQFITDSASATMFTLLYLVILLNLLIADGSSGILIKLLEYEGVGEASYLPVMLLPNGVFFRFLQWVTKAAAAEERITFANMFTYGSGAIGYCFIYSLLHSVLWPVLLWYCENTIRVGDNSGSGAAKEHCFCLKRNNNVQSESEDIEQSLLGLPDDLKSEKERAINPSKKSMMKIQGLQKRFGDFIAVQDSYFDIDDHTCFGLLGSNGAGKTTTISMLTGLITPTKGTAIINGEDLWTDMHKIQQVMGVCPQHNHLWGPLTGEDHLNFFGRLKGYSGAELKEMVQLSLKAVNLKGKHAKKKSSDFSGGMKRRLSVACR